MNYEIYPDSANYTCQVLKVKNLRLHPNANKLQIAVVQGNSVICGLDTKVDDLVLFFPLETQLSEDFAIKNDLIRRKDADGKAAGGLFEAHRRIKCVKLRGEVSEGYIAPLEYLDTIGINSSKLQEGDEFNIIDGKEVCRKYVIKSRNRNTSVKQGKAPKLSESKLVSGQFAVHYDTSPLKKNLHNFKETDLVVISEKMHGCVASLGKVLCKKKLSKLEKFFKWCGLNIVDTEYADVYSSRKVIKNTDLNTGAGFYNFDVWTECYEKYKDTLQPNLILHGEIVGELPTGAQIQKGYLYNCEPNNWDFYVFRIVFVSANGKNYEFSWQQVKNYCEKYGLNHVKELFYGKISDFMLFADSLNRDVGYVAADDSFEEQFLSKLGNTYLEKVLPEGVPFEGICIRNESKDFVANKFKARNFLGYETTMLDAGETNIEDNESAELIEEGVNDN